MVLSSTAESTALSCSMARHAGHLFSALEHRTRLRQTHLSRASLTMGGCPGAGSSHEGLTECPPPPPASRSGLKGGLQKPTGAGRAQICLHVSVTRELLFPKSSPKCQPRGRSLSLVRVPAKGKVFRSETTAFLLPFEGKMYTQGICHLLHRRAPDQGHLLNWFNLNVILEVTHPSPSIFTRSIRN